MPGSRTIESGRRPQASSEFEAFLKKRADLCDHVSVGRVELHGGRFALHVHEHDAGSELADDFRHVRIAAKCRNVVDDAGACLQRLAGDLGFDGIHGDRHGRDSGQFFDNRNDAAPFLFQRNRLGAGPARFAADVENVGAVGNELKCMLDCACGGIVLPAVGKTVWRNVDDAHDQARGPISIVRSRHRHTWVIGASSQRFYGEPGA